MQQLGRERGEQELATRSWYTKIFYWGCDHQPLDSPASRYKPAWHTTLISSTWCTGQTFPFPGFIRFPPFMSYGNVNKTSKLQCSHQGSPSLQGALSTLYCNGATQNLYHVPHQPTTNTASTKRQNNLKQRTRCHPSRSRKRRKGKAETTSIV